MGTNCFAVAALAACLTSPALAQCPSPPADHPTVAVRGTVTVERQPDVAEVTVSVLSRDPTLDGASRAHQARVAKAAVVLDHLKGQGVTVDVGGFSLSEERAAVAPGARPGNDPPTYRTATRYDLTIPKLDRVDDVVGEIVSAGLFEIGSARFSLADDTAAVDDARSAAMVDAKRQAEVYADVGGLRLDGIDRIVDGETGPRGDGAFDLPMRMARSASVGIVPPKSLEFVGSVTVMCHIVPR